MDLDADNHAENQGILVTVEDIRSRVEVDPETQCAHWKKKFFRNKPIFYKNGRVVYARSEVYKLRKGLIPRGFYVYMLCKNWDCVNSRHMGLKPFGPAPKHLDADNDRLL